MKKVMRDKNVDMLETMMHKAMQNGVKLIACTMSMDIMGIKAEELIDGIDYAFDESRRAGFATAIRRYWPGVDEARLQPAYTGIRPKISGPGEAAADFVVQGPATHGVPGLLNLFGIESPGLTASLATTGPGPRA